MRGLEMWVNVVKAVSAANLVKVASAASAAAVLTVLTGCERPPVETKQIGFRGTAMAQISNPRTVQAAADLHVAPESLPPAEVSPDSVKASARYKNVKVLGELSTAEFTRTMVAITSWVAPQEGCTYCHNPRNLADDSKYQKVVARRMIQMTRHLNADWKPHVGATGVTCYTCHRGVPLPVPVWAKAADRKHMPNSIMGDLAGQNQASKSVGYSSLPYDTLTSYLLEDKPIRVQGVEAMQLRGADANRKSTKQAEHTYGLMMHMSQSLGVNCTFCHNTRAFQSWEQSTPQRTTAWYGIRMARDINVAYIESLAATFPLNPIRHGPQGDPFKVSCGTCHKGVNKPLNGAKMAQDYPAMTGPPSDSGALALALPAGAMLPALMLPAGTIAASVLPVAAVEAPAVGAAASPPAAAKP